MSRTPLDRLLRERMKGRGIRSGLLAERLGYRRRKQHSCGELARNVQLPAKLPGAVDQSDGIVTAAIKKRGRPPVPVVARAAAASRLQAPITSAPTQGPRDVQTQERDVTTWDQLTLPRTPLGRLIYRRLRELGLRPAALAARLGYKNLSKGCRRIDEICQGDLARKERIVACLPAALELRDDVVEVAVEETRDQIERAREAERRASFRPAARITTERKVHGRCAAMLQWVYFDSDLPVEDIHRLVQTAIRRRGWTGWIDLGRPTGYVLFLSPDRRESYDVAGNLIEVQDVGG
jgi:hypothetical protein